MDEGRKRVIGIIAGIIMARNLDLFGGPQGSPRTDKMIAAAVQWATLIMKKVDVMVGNIVTMEIVRPAAKRRLPELDVDASGATLGAHGGSTAQT